MSLRGQGGSGGYAMAALLVAMAVMAVLMSVALPVWRHDARREQEEELVWRGQQYVRAIRLFQRRTQTLPTSVDMLVQGHYLRKKYKDPVTNEDFLPVPAAGAIPGQGGQTVGGGRQGTQQSSTGSGGRQGSATSGSSSGRFGAGSTTSSAFTSTTVPGGMMGVVSKSKDESIRLYQGRNHYNEWTFIFVSQQPGGPGGRGQPGGPNGGQRPGGGNGFGRGTGPGGGSGFGGGGGFPGSGGTGFPGGPRGGPGGTGGVPFPPPGGGPVGRPGGAGGGPGGVPFPVPGGGRRGGGSL